MKKIILFTKDKFKFDFKGELDKIRNLTVEPLSATLQQCKINSENWTYFRFHFQRVSFRSLIVELATILDKTQVWPIKSILFIQISQNVLAKSWKTLRKWYFFNPKKVTVQKYASVPAELHDKCNLEEINPELKCDVLDAFLICRPFQCGTDDRFRCDCNVYDHG